MEFLFVLAKQPLFRLIAGVIVLLITDMKPLYGFVAFIAWVAWVSMSAPHGRHIF